MKIIASYVIASSLLGWALWATAADDDVIKRGEYIANTADCVACHTVQGGKKFAGGREFKLPFGSLFTPNITSDKETGIGTWSDDDFVSAVQQGVGKDGKHYYPAFPYTSYTLMPREDILAIKQYLFSLPPVHEKSRPDTLAFPFNQRWGMAIWNWMFFDNARFAVTPEKSAEWNRGAYLVEGPGHCGECHTPRNLMQATVSSKALGGAEIEGWRAYNISSDAQTGVGSWSIEELTHYLTHGYQQGRGVAAGPMSEVVEHSLGKLDPADVRAIAVYLKDSKPQQGGVPRPAPRSTATPVSGTADPQMVLGQKIFADACAGCHKVTGEGNNSDVATLSGTKTVNDKTAANLLGVLLTGHTYPGMPRDHFMPDFAKNYSDQELAAVSTFILHRFGDSGGTITAERVQERKKEL
ncbi:cytochrome c [Pseudomonas abietaniphila]|uniref:c-type cytochrome n=1 Tax=Pseudomonas abietaniphila TaxID=89065 RepID=UPI003217742F